MNRLNNRHHQPACRRRIAAAPSRWHIGQASISTEELVAWQLGPSRIGMLENDRRTAPGRPQDA
jgi:hypothetical protein